MLQIPLLQDVLAWVLTGIVLAAGYPWARWMLAKAGGLSGFWLTAAVTLAVSYGGLTLLMLWMSLLGIPWTAFSVSLLYAALMAVGWVISRKLPMASSAPDSATSSGEFGWLRWIGLAAAGLVAGAVLVNAVYWPFSRADALAIYGYYGKQMAYRGSLIPLYGPESLYLTYPVGVPLAYAYTHLLAGWANPYLARVFPALLSLGCLPLVYTLGALLRGRGAGWAGMLLLAVMPTFGSWASAGYVDLPMGYFYLLAAVFAWRTWGRGSLWDGILTGASVGLAAWTKNAGLVGVVLLAAWMLLALMQRKVRWRTVIATGAACALVGAPWYIRNLIGAGFLIPSTAWTDQAKHTLDSLLIFITRPEIFGPGGWVVLAGVLWSGYRAVRYRLRAAGDLLLSLCFVPFFAIWWALVSYDPRFLLLFLPLGAVAGGLLLVTFWEQLPQSWKNRTAMSAAVIALVLAGMSAFNSLEYKDELLRNPLMNNEDKQLLIFGDVYRAAVLLNGLDSIPQDAAVITSDMTMAFHIDPPKTASPFFERLDDYEVFVGVGEHLPDSVPAAHVQEIARAGMFTIYRILAAD